MIRTYKILLFLIIPFNFCWSQINVAPQIDAVGDQIYCPLNEINIVTDFNIIDPDDIEIDILKINISEGYVNGQDILALTGSHPNIINSWDANKGRLTLSGVGNTPMLYTDLIAAVKDVIFSSSSVAVSGEKIFLITIGPAEYLPLTGHYYEYVRHVNIPWDKAKFNASVKNYFGIEGYLSTITSIEEALLTGELALDLAWIGGSDEEGIRVWEWEAGPEAGTVFWNGGVDGSTPNFANWKVNEPSSSPFSEFYAVISKMGNLGEWDNLPRFGVPSGGPFQVKGYVVEYGGMPNDPSLSITASTKVTIPSIINVIDNSRCGPGSVALEVVPSDGTVYWFNTSFSTTPLNSGLIFNTPNINTTTTYYVLASRNGCYKGIKVPVVATVNQIPVIQLSIVLGNCDEDGLSDGFTDFNLNEANDIITNGNSSDLNFTYYLSFNDADTKKNSINSVPFNNTTASTVFARVESLYGCYRISTVNLQVFISSLPLGFMYELEHCDDDFTIDGKHFFNLSQASTVFISQFPTGQSLSVRYFRNLIDAQFGQNEVSQIRFENETPFSQVLYVRVQSNINGECFGFGPHLKLTVHPRPEFEVDQSEIFCLDEGPITLFTYNAKDDYTYKWVDNDGNVISDLSVAVIDKNGTYTVIGTSDLNCESAPVSFEVLKSAASDIDMDDITVVDLSENNSISIDASNIGIGDYEFSLDNISGPFTNKTFFDDVPSGNHILYVKDKNGCSTTRLPIFILGFPKFFTPNGDGDNDVWNIQGLGDEYAQNSTVFIYDRYGKFIKQLAPGSNGWNGTFNGIELGNSDFWFVVNLVDNMGNSSIYRGHFSLVR